MPNPAATPTQNMNLASAASGVKQALVPLLKNVTLNGKYGGWQNVPQLPIYLGANRSAFGQLGYDMQNLYARFVVQAESPFRNTPQDYKLLFKSGHAVEVQLGTDTGVRSVRGQNMQTMLPGDIRIIIARSKEGQLFATCYRPVITAKEKPNQASFETQSSGKVTFDEIVPYERPAHAPPSRSAVVWWKWRFPGPGWASLRKAGCSWAAIWALSTATKAARGMPSAISGRIKAPEVSINNDIPSESQMHPNQWGRLSLE